MKNVSTSYVLSPEIFPIKTRLNRIFSLPILLLLISVFLITYGFWNIYNHEYQTQLKAAIEPNMYQEIKDISKSTNVLINQSITLGGVSLANRVSEKAFFVSDGYNVLLVIAPKKVDVSYIEEDTANIQRLLTLRGKIFTFDEKALKRNQLSPTTTLLKKQTIYLELTEPPEFRYSNPSNLSDIAETI